MWVEPRFFKKKKFLLYCTSVIPETATLSCSKHWTFVHSRRECRFSFDDDTCFNFSTKKNFNQLVQLIPKKTHTLLLLDYCVSLHIKSMPCPMCSNLQILHQVEVCVNFFGWFYFFCCFAFCKHGDGTRPQPRASSIPIDDEGHASSGESSNVFGIWCSVAYMD
jgi:hypothetical protein